MTNLFRKDCKCAVRPANEDFTVKVGDSLQFDIFVYTSPAKDVPFDLTGATVEMLLLDNRTSPTVSVTKTVGDGLTIINLEGGHVRVNLGPADTLLLGPFGGILFYDVKLTDVAANVFTVSSGDIELVPDSP
jgi:hypothetical protein